MAERRYSYQYEPPAGVPMRNGVDEPRTVAIRDARPLAAELSLDEEGFELLQAPTAFAAFNDDAIIRSAYYAEVERLLGQATGAARVIAFDHNVRNADRAAGGEAGIRGPVPRTHNDFTARSGPERAAAELVARAIDCSLARGGGAMPSSISGGRSGARWRNGRWRWPTRAASRPGTGDSDLTIATASARPMRWASVRASPGIISRSWRPTRRS